MIDLVLGSSRSIPGSALFSQILVAQLGFSYAELHSVQASWGKKETTIRMHEILGQNVRSARPVEPPSQPQFHHQSLP